MIKITASLTAALLAGFVSNATAAVLIDSSGISAVASATHSAPFAASNTLDGLTLEGFTNAGTAGPPARPGGHQNNHWITPDATLTADITFDLGGAYNLSHLEVLNTSNTNWNDRETDTFTIQTSTDNGGSFGAASAPITLQDYTAGFQTVALTDTGVTHVRLNVTNDPLAGTNTGTADTAVGLNEVRFFQVPEPTAGIFGAIGVVLMLRRRRS